MTVAAIIVAASAETALADADGTPAVRRIADAAWAGGGTGVGVRWVAAVVWGGRVTRIADVAERRERATAVRVGIAREARTASDAAGTRELEAAREVLGAARRKARRDRRASKHERDPDFSRERRSAPHDGLHATVVEPFRHST